MDIYVMCGRSVQSFDLDDKETLLHTLICVTDSSWIWYFVWAVFIICH